jgi:hypothetical protein
MKEKHEPSIDTANRQGELRVTSDQALTATVLGLGAELVTSTTGSYATRIARTSAWAGYLVLGFWLRDTIRTFSGADNATSAATETSQGDAKKEVFVAVPGSEPANAVSSRRWSDRVRTDQSEEAPSREIDII